MNKSTEISISSFSKICRLCLQKNTKLFPINKIRRNNIDLTNILHQYIEVKIQPDDNFPQHICKVCTAKMYNTHKFISIAKESYDRLQNIIYNKTQIGIDSLILNNEFSEDLSDSIEEILIKYEDTDLIKTDQNLTKTAKDKDEDMLINASSYDEEEETSIRDEPVEKMTKNKTKRTYVRTVNGPPFVCVVCSQSFNTYPELKQHREEYKHRKLKKFVCPICSHRVESNSKLVEHIYTHTGEKPHKCEVCSRKFCSKADFKRHKLVHTDERPYNCKMCNKGFTRKQYLVDHERKHTGERLICSYCAKEFTAQGALYSHEKTHKCNIDVSDLKKKDKHYECNMCDKVLLTEQGIKTHIETHGPKNFTCEQCGKAFSNKMLLSSHIRHTHSLTTYSCSLCDKIYKSKMGLYQHKRTHLGTSYTCDICTKRYHSKNALGQHQRRHMGDTRYQCKMCSHVSLNKNQLENHVRIHTGEKPFTCNYCDKGFAQKVNLQAHIRIHTGEKRCICSTCGKGFVDARSLNKHSTIHEKERNS